MINVSLTFSTNKRDTILINDSNKWVEVIHPITTTLHLHKTLQRHLWIIPVVRSKWYSDRLFGHIALLRSVISYCAAVGVPAWRLFWLDCLVACLVACRDSFWNSMRCFSCIQTCISRIRLPAWRCIHWFDANAVVISFTCNLVQIYHNDQHILYYLVRRLLLVQCRKWKRQISNNELWISLFRTQSHLNVVEWYVYINIYLYVTRGMKILRNACEQIGTLQWACSLLAHNHVTSSLSSAYTVLTCIAASCSCVCSSCCRSSACAVSSRPWSSARSSSTSSRARRSSSLFPYRST